MRELVDVSDDHVSGEEGVRPLGAGAVVVEREERRGCSWEVVDRDARSCRCAQPDLAVPVARAARQLPGQRGQVSHLLRHPGRHDLRGVSGQTVLERRTSRGVSSALFSLFPPLSTNFSNILRILSSTVPHQNFFPSHLLSDPSLRFSRVTESSEWKRKGRERGFGGRRVAR